MKRALVPLVEYAESDEEDDKTIELEPSPKKRKLPPLSTSLMVPAPVDNPALHQGRTRTHPHVDGQHATHVYISLRVKKRSAMCQLLRDVLADAKKSVPSLKEILQLEGEDDASKNQELHVSLSRPIYLRAHQREDFKRDIKQIARRHKPQVFPLSFAVFSELINDERTRTFLTIEVGAGHHELKSLALALAPVLRLLHQKEYYEHPRFHASIAWALLDQGSRGQTGASSTCSATRQSVTCERDENAPHSTPDVQTDFPTIPHLPKELIPKLNEQYSATLSSTKVALFDVEEITVKIGKDIFSWRMMGL
ncbi:hypothetical protein AX17_005190 [Amanita inopinata Kibby_2008]|nr:hypothetical protein AX17_005190 [Amanita inopinata Kibby_2008]